MPNYQQVQGGRNRVHVLWQGSTLCGFGYGKLPAYWEPGHLWVRPENAGCANCGECLQAASKIDAIAEIVVRAMQNPELK